MINNKLKLIERYLSNSGLSGDYISLRLTKTADDSDPLLDSGVAKRSVLPESAYNRWDLSERPDLLSKTKQLETTTKEALVEMFRGYYRDFTEEELRKIYPYLKQKGILFKWICKLASIEYDDIPWGELTKDSAIGMFAPDSTHQEKILAELSSVELETSLQNIEDYTELLADIERAGIEGPDGKNILDTEVGRWGSSFISDFMNKEGITNELAAALLSGQIGSDIDDQITLMLSVEDPESKFAAQSEIINSSASSYENMMTHYGNAGRDLYGLGASGLSGGEARFHPADSEISESYLNHVMYPKWNNESGHPPDADDAALYYDYGYGVDLESDIYKLWRMKKWELGEEAPPYIADPNTGLTWGGGSEREYDWYLRDWPGSDTGTGPGIDTAEIMSSSIGPWDPRWPYLNGVHQTIHKNHEESSIAKAQSIEGLSFGGENIHENLNWPNPIAEREPGYYKDFEEQEYKLWIPSRKHTLSWTNPTVGTVYSAISGYDANDEIEYETGSEEWAQSLDESTYWGGDIYGYGIPEVIQSEAPSWVFELKIIGASQSLPRTNLLREATGLHRDSALYGYYGVSDEDKLYDYYDVETEDPLRTKDPSREAFTINESIYTIDDSKYTSSKDNDQYLSIEPTIRGWESSGGGLSVDHGTSTLDITDDEKTSSYFGLIANRKFDPLFLRYLEEYDRKALSWIENYNGIDIEEFNPEEVEDDSIRNILLDYKNYIDRRPNQPQFPPPPSSDLGPKDQRDIEEFIRRLENPNDDGHIKSSSKINKASDEDYYRMFPPNAPNPYSDKKAWNQWYYGRYEYPAGVDPRLYNNGNITHETPSEASIYYNQCRNNTCHDPPPEHDEFSRLKGFDVDPIPYNQEAGGMNIPVGSQYTNSGRVRLDLPVWNINPGYDAWLGYTPYETIERARYAKTPEERSSAIDEISSKNKAARLVAGMAYDPGIPPGMNELLRATYQPHLVPFYMDRNVSSKYKIQGDGSRLSFETYNMSVPRSLRTFWLVGSGTTKSVKGEFPKSKVTQVSETKKENDELIVVASTNPGNYKVNYYLVDQDQYLLLLGSYSHMTQYVRPTLSKWATTAMRSRIESKDTRLLMYYRELEESNNDASILLSPLLHPHGKIRKGAINSQEIELNGARSEWVSDQYFASITGTSIEFFEQMHTVGFNHRTEYAERSKVPSPRRQGNLPLWVHFTWDLAGIIPVAGVLFDLAHASWYYSEGLYFFAALSILFAIPVFGDVPQLLWAGGKYGYGIIVGWLARNLPRIIEIFKAIRHPVIQSEKLIASIKHVIKQGELAKIGVPSSKQFMDDIAAQIKNIERIKTLTKDEAVKLLGGGKIGLSRFNAIKTQRAGSQAVSLLDRNARRLLKAQRHGTGPAMAAWNRVTKYVPNLWGVRALRRGSSEVTEGSLGLGTKQIFAKNASSISTLSSTSRIAWEIEKHGIRVGASGKATLLDITQGVKLRYLGGPSVLRTSDNYLTPGTGPGTRTINPDGTPYIPPPQTARQMDDWVEANAEAIAGSGYSLRHAARGAATDGTEKALYWFDDIRYLDQTAHWTKGSISLNPWQTWKRVWDNMSKVGRARWTFYSLSTATMGVSMSMGIHAALRINALLELAIEKGVPESAKLIGLDFRETFHNPELLDAKYRELTSGCPGFTLSGETDIAEAYSWWGTELMFGHIDEWLEGGFFRNIGENVSLDDYTDYKAIQQSAPNRRPRDRSMAEPSRPPHDQARRDQFTAQWDYSKDCPDGDTEGEYVNLNYKSICDPNKPEYIGGEEPLPGYSVKLPASEVPEDWYESLSESGSGILGTHDSGGAGLYYPKEISKANVLADMLEKNPELVRDEIEKVYKKINNDFEVIVLESLGVIHDGANTLDAQCDPYQIMHLLIVSKFARYLSLDDITLKYAKWNVMVDLVTGTSLLTKYDSATWVPEILMAGEVIMTEIPKWANLSAKFKSLEEKACSDSYVIMEFIANFLMNVKRLSQQSEHGFDFNYITQDSGIDINPKWSESVPNTVGEDINQQLDYADRQIRSGIGDVGEYEAKEFEDMMRELRGE
jgi:hypothetical protein